MRHKLQFRVGLDDRYLQFLSRLEPQWKKDDILLTLLSAVMLFSAENISAAFTGKLRYVLFFSPFFVHQFKHNCLTVSNSLHFALLDTEWNISSTSTCCVGIWKRVAAVTKRHFASSINCSSSWDFFEDCANVTKIAVQT
jgi:hypothetical protein